MIAYILFQKIITFFLILVGGFLLVRCRILKSSESRVLSLIFINLVMPCGIINAFQVDYEPRVMKGLLFCFAVAAGIHIFFVVGNALIRRPLNLSTVEQLSVIYPACANLTIPLVSAMMGEEWVIYTSAFFAVQMVLMWSHCIGLLCGEKGVNFKKMLTNLNMIAILIGIVLFLTHIRLPGPIRDTMSTMGSMMGPMSMLIAGMLVAQADIPGILKNRRVWMVTGMRLILVPAVIIGIFRLLQLDRLAENGHSLLLIILMGLNTPPASSIIQLTQVYTGDDGAAEYASAINVLCTVLCMITMPLTVMLWM